MGGVHLVRIRGAVSSAVLRVVQRRIRSVDETLAVAGVIGGGGDADAQRNGQCCGDAAQLERAGLDAL